MDKKKKELDHSDNLIQNEVLQEFTVYKQFTLDRVYNPTDIFKNSNKDTIDYLLTNKFIK